MEEPSHRGAARAADGPPSTHGGGARTAASEVEEEDRGERVLTRKEAIWLLIEDNPIVNTCFLIVIVFSTVCFVLETEFRQEDLYIMWFGFETFAVTVFTFEYTVRLLVCPKRCKFIWEPLNIIDLIAIVPYYITLVYAAALGVDPWNPGSSSEFIKAGTVFRAVRLVRVFRIFKLGRYSAGMQVFLSAIAHSATSLSLLGFLMAITVVLFSSVMYLIEAQGDMDDEECAEMSSGQCEFRTIITSFWWAIVTMTTVGYGDAVPRTALGKVVASLLMVAGIIVIALPISVLGNNFTKLMQQYNDDSVVVAQADMDGSGFVDAKEVGRWLQAMRKAGKIRDERVTAEELIRRYDKGGKVGLERREFLRMCRETVQQSGPSNRELMQKLQRLGMQLSVIDERLQALETHEAGTGAPPTLHSEKLRPEPNGGTHAVLGGGSGVLDAVVSDVVPFDDRARHMAPGEDAET